MGISDCITIWTFFQQCNHRHIIDVFFKHLLDHIIFIILAIYPHPSCSHDNHKAARLVALDTIVSLSSTVGFYVPLHISLIAKWLFTFWTYMWIYANLASINASRTICEWTRQKTGGAVPLIQIAGHNVETHKTIAIWQ